MKRVIVYPGAIPQDLDLLNTNKNAMLSFGFLIQAILGTSTLFDGLACTPTGPATMTVNVAPGSVYSLQNVDNTAYGSIASDVSDQVMKHGIVLGTQNFSTPAPATTGFSIVYLIEAAFEETDNGSTVLPYYNAANPSVPYNGPNNTGTSQNTARDNICLVQIKTGTAAATGTQTTPAPDAGFTGLFAITVANGQTTVTSGNIVQLASAPFIGSKLTQIIAAVQSGALNYAVDSSGAANTVTVTLSPAISAYTAGLPIVVKVANTTTNASAVMNVNAIGNVALYGQNGQALAAGALIANGTYIFVYDGSHFVLQGNGSASTIAAPAQGEFKNLKIVNTSNTAGTITADSIVLQDSSGNTKKITSVNVSYATGSSGANGLDTGSLANSTWYNEFVIYNPTSSTTSSLISLSETAPTLPSGYTMFARVGSIRIDASAHILWKIQYGRDAQYVLGTNPSAEILMASGASGSITTPTWTALAVGAFVPPLACKIKLNIQTISSNGLMVAPNNSYGAQYTTSSPPFWEDWASGGNGGSPLEMILESANIYYASNSTGTGYVYCIGWTDNL